ncbi:MAG: cyclic nucleotide-binding/CBS domain-containing protein [Candidatus Bathyarchaeia archaeon]
MELHVEDVLVRKAVTIESESTVKEAAEQMEKYSTSSLVVLTDGVIMGILTTRDIVSRVVSNGLEPMKVPVKEVMTSPVIMMRTDTPLGEAIKIMLQNKIKKLPIFEGERDNARLVGMISLTDMMEFHPEIFTDLWTQVLMTVPATAEKSEVHVA